MKTATVADLRNHFRRVAAWIEAGETVRILKRGRAFAQLTKESPSPAGKQLPKVDFLAQIAEVWGGRVFTDAEVAAMRRDEREMDRG